MNKVTKAILVVALAVIVASGGFVGGFAVARLAPTDAIAGIAASSSNNALGSHVDQIYRLLRDRALSPPSETSATAGSIQGLLDANGDKYAMYFDQKHYQFFSEESMGAFGGIGVVLGEKDGSAYVVEVYKGTPAFNAGVKAGDVFEVIDGVSRTKWTSQEVVKRVRGDAGTKVTITMLRPAAGGKGVMTEKTFTLTRAKVTYPNIKSEMKGSVGYIRLGQFNAKSADDVKAAVQSLTGKGAKSFVLDLRDDPGGLLDQAIAVSSLFIKDGVIVRVDERNVAEKAYRALGTKITDAPLFVLMNGDSASASEITAGALQDYGRATLVGEKSFGKGSVQTIEELPWGGAVKFTIAHYLTPKKRVINGKGLQPDVLVKMDRVKEMNPKTDTQLMKALDLASKAAAK